MQLLDNLVDSCNPVIGCTYPCCNFCYAKILNDRFHYIEDFSQPEVRLHALKKIHTRKDNAKVFFMNSMSDIADWPRDVVETVFKEMKAYPHNNYFFLTKRPNKIRGLDCSGQKNVWIGVSVTNRHDVWRIDALRSFISASNYTVQFEPLLGDVGKIDLSNISQITIGADSRKTSNKIVPEFSWIDNIVTQANNYRTPLWIKDSLASVVGLKNLRQDYLPYLSIRGH